MIYRRGKFWWFEFMYKGERVRESTHQGNRQAAREIEAAYRTKLAKGEVDLEERAPVPSFSDFAKRFGDEMDSRHASKPKTRSYYSNGLKKLTAHFGNVRLDKVDEDA